MAQLSGFQRSLYGSAKYDRYYCVDFIDKKFTVRVNGTAVFEADLVDPPTGTTAVFVVPSNDLQRGGKSNVLVSSVRISELK